MLYKSSKCLFYRFYVILQTETSKKYFFSLKEGIKKNLEPRFFWKSILIFLKERIACRHREKNHAISNNH